MLLTDFLRDRQGSAVRGFAFAAAAITVVAAVGAHGLAWVAQSGRLPIIAFVPLDGRPLKSHTAGDVDPTTTGSIRRSVLDVPPR